MVCRLAIIFIYKVNIEWFGWPAMVPATACHYLFPSTRGALETKLDRPVVLWVCCRLPLWIVQIQILAGRHDLYKCHALMIKIWIGATSMQFWLAGYHSLYWNLCVIHWLPYAHHNPCFIYIIPWGVYVKWGLILWAVRYDIDPVSVVSAADTVTSFTLLSCKSLYLLCCKIWTIFNSKNTVSNKHSVL